MDNLTTVIAIVPRLPPAIDGVGDYALNLARQLRKDFNIHTHFIVGNSTWQGTSEIEGFNVSQVTDNSANILVNVLSNYHSSSPVLLHYVGYGYAKRGCPIWLVDGLQRWKSLYPKSNLVTMFHELYASGYPPWTSSFWLSPLQKSLAVRLTQLSDRCITNRQDCANTLNQLTRFSKPEIIIQPVFSNIGELKEIPLFSQRSRNIVIFGHPNSKKQVYQQCIKQLEQTCQTLKIKMIYDIGKPTGLELSSIKGIPIEEMGVMTSEEISCILTNSIAAFMNFPPPEQLAKSGIFAAYCAHGLVSVMTSSSQKIIDGLEGGKHYWVADGKSGNLCLDTAQMIAQNAYLWYENHNLSKQVKVFADYLN
ncbi:MAG: glycosyltransferase family 1 protein [Dolichospermum sp.]